MNKRRLTALLVALALLPGFPGALASHTGWYARNPVEHDDQGRSNEPDFTRTAVLGPLVENRVIDANLDGIAVADSLLGVGPGAKLAPGCTDDSGRRPSGLCGLWTIGVGTSQGVNRQVVPGGIAGVQGMTGASAPGAFTPTKGTVLRFLDVLHHLQLITAGTTYLELNRKLDDSGTRPLVGSVDPNLANSMVTGPQGVWAWYGRWADKNGNGVVDSLYNCTGQPCPPRPPEDEFAWYGNCFQFPSGLNPDSVRIGWCALDSEAALGGTTTMVGWMFPGNHHAFCGGFLDPLFVTCANHPADVPGRQVLHFLGANDVPVCVGTTFNPFVGWICDTDLRTFDDTDEQFLGDPLLGPQNSVAPDQDFNDRSGDPRIDVRQWVYGLGWQTYFYDQSVLVSLVHVTGVGCDPDRASPNKFLLGTCRFLDVDRFGSMSPAAGSLLQGSVKPAARSNWVLLRNEWIPVAAGVDAVRNNRALDASPVTGPLDDRATNPGFSREPNAGLDVYPGATRGVCVNPDNTHNGFCNNYDAHKLASHAFADLLPIRAVIVNRPVGAGGCVLCVAGIYLASGYAGEAPGGALRDPGDHRRTLGPGQYIFFGLAGLWRDRAQVWSESFYDATCAVTPSNALGTCGGTTGLVRSRTYTAAPDGWVGNIVNQTGTWYYRGYTNEGCTTDQGTGVKPYGACHPYLDGEVENPQGYGLGEPAHAEWVGRCDGVSNNAFVLRPADGTWSVPVFVWRAHFNGMDLDDPSSLPIPGGALEDFTGKAGDIVLSASCGTGAVGGDVDVNDAVILPLGNQGETVHTFATVSVGAESVRDLDVYVGWG